MGGKNLGGKAIMIVCGGLAVGVLMAWRYEASGMWLRVLLAALAGAVLATMLVTARKRR